MWNILSSEQKELFEKELSSAKDHHASMGAPMTDEEIASGVAHRLFVSMDKDVMGLKGLEIDVHKIYRIGEPLRYYEGYCFHTAMRYAVDKIDVPGVTVVFGSYCKSIFKRRDKRTRCQHVWIELPREIVFDGVLQRFYDKAGYYRKYHIEVLEEHTARYAVDNFKRQGTDGTGFHDFESPDTYRQYAAQLNG